MYRNRAKSGWHIIDEKMIRTDSIMEAAIIQRLVDHGFSGKWRRMRKGIAFGMFRYTPDVELCILHDSMNRRALVEFKVFSAVEFTIDRRKAMLAISHFYHDSLCYLYVEQTRQWFMIERDGTLLKTGVPTPGGVPIDQLPKPKFMIPVWNAYGRSYVTRPSTLLLKKTADGLEFIVKSFIYSPKSKKKQRNK